MATTQELIDSLKQDKSNLVSMLNNMGVEASEDETFTSLIPKVADCGGKTPEVGFMVNELESNGYATKVTVLGMTSLPDYAFYSGTVSNNAVSLFFQKLKEVVLPDIMTKLGLNAFCNCTSLEDINIPDGITEIPQYCFYRCTNLALTELPDSITTFNTYGYCFYNCTNLALTELPSKLTSIPQYCFYNCANITINKIPDGVTALNGLCFYGCTNITEIDLNNVTNLGGNNFEGCSNLQTVIGTNLKTIGNTNHFKNCTSLKNVYLPLLTTINGAFYGCTSLVQVSLPSVTTFSNSPFYKCTSLKAVWIGSNITSTGFIDTTFNTSAALEKMFIDLPRATVETYTYYSSAFSKGVHSTDIIICNDDEGFMTQEEFDAIDWSTYTE